ncbi:MAG: hypothetical protein AAF799_31285 [Myxococcota bacterium]
MERAAAFDSHDMNTALLRLTSFLTASLLLASCADEQGPPPFAEVCGQSGQALVLPLAESSWGAVLGEIDDRLLVATRGLDSHEPDARVDLHLIGKCGEDPVSLGDVSWYASWLAADGVLYSGGDWGVQLHELTTGRTEDFAPEANWPALPTPFGTITLERNGGALVLHPNPLDASVEAITLLEFTGDVDRSHLQVPLRREALDGLWTDGAGVLALGEDDEVLRVDLVTHESTVVASDIEQFRVVDDGQQLLFLRDSQIGLHDLRDGRETMLSDVANITLAVAYVQDEAGPWLVMHPRDGQIVNLDRHEVLPANGHEPIGIYEVGDGLTVVESFDTSPFIGPWGVCNYDLLEEDGTRSRLADGIGCNMDRRPKLSAEGLIGEASDEVSLFPFDGAAPEPIGRTFGGSFEIVDDHVVSIDDQEISEHKTRLVIDGPRYGEVLSVHAAKARPWKDGEDLYYFAVGYGLMRVRLEL